MKTKARIAITLDEQALEKMEAFAKANGMSRSGAINLHVKLAVDFMGREDTALTRIGMLESQLKAHLKAMQQANYKALVYLVRATPIDKPRYEQAEASAVKNVSEIFGEEEK